MHPAMSSDSDRAREQRRRCCPVVAQCNSQASLLWVSNANSANLQAAEVGVEMAERLTHSIDTRDVIVAIRHHFVVVLGLVRRRSRLRHGTGKAHEQPPAANTNALNLLLTIGSLLTCVSL